MLKDIKFWMVVAVTVFVAVGMVVGQITWPDAGNVLAIVAGAYIGSSAVKEAIIQVAERRGQ